MVEAAGIEMFLEIAEIIFVLFRVTEMYPQMYPPKLNARDVGFYLCLPPKTVAADLDGAGEFPVPDLLINGGYGHWKKLLHLGESQQFTIRFDSHGYLLVWLLAIGTRVRFPAGYGFGSHYFNTSIIPSRISSASGSSYISAT
jgi:hypothetical protein